MKIVHRQDGSVAELDDAEAEQWIKRGLATAPPVKAKPVPKQTTDEGEVK